MRVTNEQAKSALKADHITGNTTKIIQEYAADLLDARRLIKEMREVITNIKKDFQPQYHDCVDDGLPQCAWCDGDDILEKTKEYAE